MEASSEQVKLPATEVTWFHLGQEFYSGILMLVSVGPPPVFASTQTSARLPCPYNILGRTVMMNGCFNCWFLNRCVWMRISILGPQSTNFLPCKIFLKLRRFQKEKLVAHITTKINVYLLKPVYQNGVLIDLNILFGFQPCILKWCSSISVRLRNFAFTCHTMTTSLLYSYFFLWGQITW